MKSRHLIAALQRVVADRSIRESGNLKQYVLDRDLAAVLEIADGHYTLPINDKGKESSKLMIDLGRDAKEKSIHKVILPKDVIFFIGSEADVIRKLEEIPVKTTEIAT